ncbi:ureidoglycolate lyase [Pontibacillus yanchengensis]|uniref:Ureidoglycolate lyase n=1 Tax=Pontibacillus yanchengensis TaxID=462910 RepID=A0A6I5A1Q2_9BACI|nr:fumarylacetoacetate hydrolase family protein [Pontibacillus yanchengensis]MYL34382.1 ureidoglycolate lyase [Pontibacillus yanchengensis]
MKFIQFTVDHDSSVKKGIISSEGVKEISGNIFTSWDYTGDIFKENQIKVTSPLEPNQVIGIGANFVKEPEDLPAPPEMPVFFFKPTSSVIGPNEDIVIPEDLDSVKFESEIAVVIGKNAKNIQEDEVADYIFGYTIGNDVTAPQYFHSDGHWMLGKAFDTFTPLGPAIETDFDLAKTRIKAYHNEEKKQDSNVDVMIVSINKMISYLSRVLTLKAGDVILTGSPVGAEFLQEEDTIECEVEGIGRLRNQVVKERKKVSL